MNKKLSVQPLILLSLELLRIYILLLLLSDHVLYEVSYPIFQFCRHFVEEFREIRMLSWQPYKSYSQNVGVAIETKLHDNKMHLVC